MAAPCFIAWNAVTPTTAIQAAGEATGTTALFAMLQIKAGTPKIRIIEWGYAFSTVPTTTPVTVDLVTTSTGLTMAASLASGDVLAYNDVTGPASQIATGSASNSGYGPTTETAATFRTLAKQYEFGTQFKQQFPLGREPEVNGGQFLRIRMAGVSLTASMYVIWEE
jgi:hypothetical protein